MGKKAWTIESINDYLIKNNINQELLSTTYKNTDSNLTWKCKICGNVYNKTWHHFKSSKYETNCPVCMKEITYNKKRLTCLEVQKRLESLNLILIGEYKNNATPIKVQDKNGYIYYITVANIRPDNNYIKNIFNKNNPYLIQNVNLYFSLNEISLFCDYQEVNLKNGKVHLSFKCSCGKTFQTTLDSIMQNKIYCCKECSKKKSKFERIIEKYLIEIGISYKTQIKFDTCKNIRSLPFDFGVYKNNNLLFLLEIDGQQHFQPCNFNGIDESAAIKRYEETIKNDNIKNTWCIENDIKLIRISYKDVLNKKYINIINNYL